MRSGTGLTLTLIYTALSYVRNLRDRGLCLTLTRSLLAKEEPSAQDLTWNGLTRTLNMISLGPTLKVGHDTPSAQPISLTIDVGFGGLTSRKTKKPVIAAVNALAYGGGRLLFLHWLYSFMLN